MKPSPDPRRPLAAALALLLVAGPPGAVRGDDRVDMASVDIQSLLDLSVQAVTRRVERASEAPATVFVVTGDDIRRQGLRTLAEVLGTVPGLYGFSGNMLQQVGVRGMGFGADYTTRLLVLVDGHPITNSVGTEVSRGLPVALEAVQRVEVIKGPAGAVYGPSAFFGVVNVVTAGGPPGASAWLGAEAGQSEVRAGEGAAAWRGRLGEADLLVAANGWRSSGFDYRFPEAVGTPGAEDGVARGMDFGDAGSGYLRAGWRGFGAAAACGHSYSGLTGFIPTNRRTAFESLTCFAELSWQGKAAQDLSLQARLAADDFEGGAARSQPEPPAGLGHFVNQGHDRWGTAEVRADWRPLDRLRLDAGATGRFHQLEHEERSAALPALDAKVTREFSEVNAWASAEVRVGRDLALHGGATWYEHSSFGGRATPKAAAVWQPGPDDTVKAIWSNGFRPPTFVEAFFSDTFAFLSNPGLRPEKVSSTEAAYEHRFGGVASVGASFFWNRYRDLIYYDTVPAPGLSGPPASAADFRQQARNAPGHLDLVGGELSLTFRRGQDFQAYGGVSLQRLDERARTDFPAVTANLALSTRWPWRALLLSGRATYVGSRHGPEQPGLPRYEAPEAFSLAALAAYDVPAVPGLTVEAGVVNLLDAPNRSPAPNSMKHRGIPEGPRTLRADVRWKF